MKVNKMKVNLSHFRAELIQKKLNFERWINHEN